MTKEIELNRQEILLLEHLLEPIAFSKYYDKTTKTIAEQLIVKINKE